jgi:hypothetical protein
VFVATLLTSGAGVAAPAETARADDCLSAPNSAAPQGSHWYYRLDHATKRKCWYVRALGPPAQHAAAPAAMGPATSLHSTPAPSAPNPAREGPGVSVSTGEAAAPPPLTEMPAATPNAAPAISAATDNIASSIPDKPAPPASTRSETSADANAPARDTAPAISATDPSVQQSALAENTGSIPNAPAPQASTSSETGDQAAAPAPFAATVSSATTDRPAQKNEQKENTASIQDAPAAPASTPPEASAPAAAPPAVAWAPLVKAVPTDATAATASENAERTTARLSEPTKGTGMPMRMFLALALGLAVIGIVSRLVIKIVAARRAPVITDRPELDPYDDPEFYRKLREGVALNKPQ